MTDVPPPVIHQTIQGSIATRMFQVANAQVYLAEGSLPGVGLWEWADWVQLVEKGTRGAATEATRAVLNGQTIGRNAEQTVVKAVLNWASTDTPSSLIIGINGKHGSGATVSLFSIARSLVSESICAQVFVVDDVENFSKTDLTKALPSHNKTILVIDDADKQLALKPVRLALRRLSLCVVYTSSDPTYSKDMIELNEAESTIEVPLNERPGKDELRLLQSLFKRPHLSNSEKQALARANFRSAVRVLKGGLTTESVMRRLLKLRESELPLTARAVEYLIFATSLDLLLPQSLLRRAIGGDIPREVMSWVQIRPYRRQRDKVDHLLWIEDRTAAKEAENYWRHSSQMDERSYADSSRIWTESLIGAASVESAVDRVFIRRLLSHLPYELRRIIATSHIAVLREMAGLEQGQDLAFGWLPLLKLGGVHLPSFLASKIASNFGALNDGLDIVLAILAIGGDRVADELSVEVDGAGLWSAHAWVHFISMLEHFPVSRVPELVRAAMPWLRTRSDLADIFNTWNTLQILLPLVERHALPSDRLAIHGQSLLFIATRPNVVDAIFRLTSRCILQPRSELAIRALQVAVQDDTSRKAKMFTVFSEQFQELARDERSRSLGRKTLDSVVLEDSMAPSIQNQVRRSALAFASKWSPGEVVNLVNENAAYLRAVLVGSPFNHCADLHLNVMREMAQRGLLSEENIPIALAPFTVVKSNRSVGRAAITALIAFSSSKSLYSFQAKSALYELISGEPKSAIASVEAFLDDVGAIVVDGKSLHVPPELSRLDAKSSIQLVQDLIFAIRYLGYDEQALVRTALRRWKSVPTLRARLAGEVLRLDMQDEAQALVCEGGGRSASWVCFKVSTMAKIGNLPEARAGMSEVYRQLRLNRDGAHPFAMTRAAAFMSKATEDVESELYKLIRDLLTLGPLSKS